MKEERHTELRTARFTEIKQFLTTLPPSYGNEAFVTLVGNTLMLEIWPVIFHPASYPAVWERLEAVLLQAKEHNPVEGSPLNTALLAVTGIARSARRDEAFFAQLLDIPGRSGVAARELARCLGSGIATVIYRDPALLDPATNGREH